MTIWPLRHRQGLKNSAPAELATLLQSLWRSPARKRISLLAGGIVVVVCLTVVGQIRLNAWYQPFYDALARKDVTAFGRQILVFMAIVGALLALNVAQNWLHEMTKVKLREWLTHDLLDHWLEPGRAFRIACAGEIGANPDQRIQEDARHLTELWADLGIGFFQASLLLVSFVGVLWLLSSEITLPLGGLSITIPGYMVWCAMLYSAAASWFSWRIGRPLIGLNVERYAREAEFRFALVRLSEHADGVALYGGEQDERRRIDSRFDPVLAIMRRLVGAATRLTWVTAGSGWIAIVVPFLVAAPGYFWGGFSFGGLMMAVAAFQQVQQALRWFVDNFGRIADWRATLRRVMSLRRALLAPMQPAGTGGRITFEDHPSGGLSFEGLRVSFANSCAALDEERVEIGPGERVLIVGKPGSGKSTLFRAIAGLWPWGSGNIRLPPRETMMFLPQRPYLPLGSLRTILTYPAPTCSVDAGAITTALERTGLGYLSGALDRTERWDKELSIDEQQRLSFARLLLHKPRWVILDDVIDAFDEDYRGLILSLFDTELPSTGVISIARRPARNGFYTRTLRLIREPIATCAHPSLTPSAAGTSGFIHRPATSPAPAIEQPVPKCSDKTKGAAADHEKRRCERTG